MNDLISYFAASIGPLATPLRGSASQARLFVEVIRYWWNGVLILGWTDAIIMILCLFYVISPIDLIPDFIPILGFVDDIWAIAQVALIAYYTMRVAKRLQELESQEVRDSIVLEEQVPTNISGQQQPVFAAEECVICLDKQPNIIFESCRHKICCEECSKHVRACPYCRRQIRQKIKTSVAAAN